MVLEGNIPGLGKVTAEYMHLAGIGALKEGDKVKAGQIIGYLGASGTALGRKSPEKMAGTYFTEKMNGSYANPHLHLQMRDAQGRMINMSKGDLILGAPKITLHEAMARSRPDDVKRTQAFIRDHGEKISAQHEKKRLGATPFSTALTLNDPVLNALTQKPTRLTRAQYDAIRLRRDMEELGAMINLQPVTRAEAQPPAPVLAVRHTASQPATSPSALAASQ